MESFERADLDGHVGFGGPLAQERHEAARRRFQVRHPGCAGNFELHEDGLAISLSEHSATVQLAANYFRDDDGFRTLEYPIAVLSVDAAGDGPASVSLSLSTCGEPFRSADLATVAEQLELGTAADALDAVSGVTARLLAAVDTEGARDGLHHLDDAEAALQAHERRAAARPVTELDVGHRYVGHGQMDVLVDMEFTLKARDEPDDERMVSLTAEVGTETWSNVRVPATATARLPEQDRAAPAPSRMGLITSRLRETARLVRENADALDSTPPTDPGDDRVERLAASIREIAARIETSAGELDVVGDRKRSDLRHDDNRASIARTHRL